MKTCLVVDDSRVVRKVARKILEQLEFDCEEAEDGRQAMQSCLDRMPDAILLDVDNGPTSLVQPQNGRIYRESGFEAIRRSLKEGGRVAFWSADPEPKFMKQLRKAGFQVTELEVKAHERAKRAQHRIYVGEKVS